MNSKSSMTGGVPIASGGYGCVFDPALKCENPTQPYNPNLISKLMTTKNAEDEKREILRFVPILSSIPNAEKYFIISVNSCVPAPLSQNDLKDFDRKCRNFKNKPEFTAVNMKNKTTLNKLLILNMLNGGVDIDMYLTRKPVNSEKIYNLVYGIKDLINNAIIPMNKRGLYHLDLKPANIVIDRTNQMRIIDWGLSDIVKDTSKPVHMLAKPIQFNNPFYMVLANNFFFNFYNDFLANDPNPKTHLKKNIQIYYNFWETHHGHGHTEYIRSLINDIYKKNKLSIAKLRKLIIANLKVMIKRNTNFTTKTFNSKRFMEILYHNIDIWGALMSLGMLFYGAINKNITLPQHKKEQLMKKLKILLDSYLFFNFDKIDITKLNADLDDILCFLRPEIEIDLSPNIAMPMPPTSNPPQLVQNKHILKNSNSINKTKKKRNKKRKSKKKIILLSNSNSPAIQSPSQQIKVKKRQPRCPKGTRRNPKTGLCEPFQAIKIQKSSSIPVININQPISKKTIKKRKPRCPKGTRRNPKTGLCEPVKL